MIHRKIALLIAVFMLLSFAASPALSVPAAPTVHTLEQHDGSKFMAKLWGDEWSHGWETTDNYSIIFDETTKDWTYAITGADGDLLPSTKVVGRDPLPNNIPEHLRPTGKAQSRILDLKASKAPGIPDKVVAANGTANIPVILINFNDRTTNYTAANFNTLLFGSGVKSMNDYYKEVSYGKFSVSPGPGGVAGWYTASKNHDYYGQNDAWGNDRWPGTLVREAVAAADAAGFNFAPYDQNSDCYVDVVNIIHQGSGEEAGGPSTDIWSHRWTLNSAYFYGYSNGGAYTTNDPCPEGGFIKINDYVIQPETLWGSQQTMGVFAHEYGHALGLPDLYDTTYSSEGIGAWSLMAGGSWNGISRSGDTPAQLDAWSKSFLGWVSPQQITYSTFKQIKQVEYNSEVYQLLDNPNGVSDWSTGNGKGEYFLIENRRKTGFDEALPGEGLLIWHIDETMDNNDNKNHKLVDLEEADGRNDLDNNNNSGDAFDPWYSSTVGFTENTIPNSKLYNGSTSGVRVTNIGASAPIMTANLIVGTETPTLSVTVSPNTVTVNTPTNVIFTVTSAGLPVENATVTLSGNATGSGTTDANGTVTISVNATSAGTITATASKSGYTSGSTSITAVTQPTNGSISGIVTNAASGIPIADASIYLDGVFSTITSSTGHYTITNVAAGSHTVKAVASGYTNATVTVTVTGGVTATANIAMTPIAGGAIISIASQTVAPGGNVTVPITAGNVTDLSAFSVTLSYDPAVVWVDKVTAGDFGTPVSNINNAAGSTSMSGISITGKSGNLVLANIVLKAVGTAGQTSPLDISVTEIVDSNGNAIPATVLNGTFTIQTSFTISANRTNVSIATSPIASTPVEFTVMLGSSPVSGATVTLSGAAAGTGITAADGKVVIMVSPTRNGTIVATATGSNTNTTALTAKGDVSGDNRVSITDALFIAQYTAGIRVLDPNTLILVFADVSGDGRASITDALFIAQASAGIPDRPVPKQGN